LAAAVTLDFLRACAFEDLKHAFFSSLRVRVMVARDVEDTERHIYRKAEDEKYSIIIANRRREDELRKTEREAEDNELRDIRKRIEDKELVSDHKYCDAQN
jgi:hypothetical protein